VGHVKATSIAQSTRLLLSSDLVAYCGSWRHGGDCWVVLGLFARCKASCATGASTGVSPKQLRTVG